MLDPRTQPRGGASGVCGECHQVLCAAQRIVRRETGWSEKRDAKSDLPRTELSSKGVPQGPCLVDASCEMLDLEMRNVTQRFSALNSNASPGMMGLDGIEQLKFLRRFVVIDARPCC